MGVGPPQAVTCIYSKFTTFMPMAAYFDENTVKAF